MKNEQKTRTGYVDWDGKETRCWTGLCLLNLDLFLDFYWINGKEIMERKN